MEMRFGKAIAVAVASVAITSLAMTGAAYAWSSDGKGNIRCGDGSSATAGQTVRRHMERHRGGSQGKTGSGYATEGKAALAACGEG